LEPLPNRKIGYVTTFWFGGDGMQGKVHDDWGPLHVPGRMSVVLPQSVRSSRKLPVTNLSVVKPVGLLTVVPLAFLKSSAVGSPSVIRMMYDFAQGTYWSFNVLVPWLVR
jgi:hypothetical protein